MLICPQRLKKVLDPMGWESYRYQMYEMKLFIVFINNASLSCLTVFGSSSSICNGILYTPEIPITCRVHALEVWN